MHSTNYYNTLIEIAEDSSLSEGTIPPLRGGKKTVAGLQFDMLFDHPYEYTSDEVLFGVFAQRKGFEDSEVDEQREAYFSKGQPCFRASPLTKKFGWGVHSDPQGKIALVGAGTDRYEELKANDTVVKVRAMRSKRK